MAAHDEVLRLRDRVHSLGGELAAERAERRRLERTVSDLERQVAELVKADEIAAEVARRVNAQRRFQFTVLQKVGATVLAAVLTIGALHDLGIHL